MSDTSFRLSRRGGIREKLRGEDASKQVSMQMSLDLNTFFKRPCDPTSVKDKCNNIVILIILHFCFLFLTSPYCGLMHIYLKCIIIFGFHPLKTHSLISKSPKYLFLSCYHLLSHAHWLMWKTC